MQNDSEDEDHGSWAESLAAIVNCGISTAFTDGTEGGSRPPPVPPPAEEEETSSMVDNLLRCGGSEAGQTYDEVVTSPQKPTDPAIPVEALYDEILSLREQVARMEAGGAFALQDELIDCGGAWTRPTATSARRCRHRRMRRSSTKRSAAATVRPR